MHIIYNKKLMADNLLGRIKCYANKHTIKIKKTRLWYNLLSFLCKIINSQMK